MTDEGAPMTAGEPCRQFGNLRFPLGPGQDLIYSVASGAGSVLGPRDLRLLLMCKSFQPLEGHARHLGQALRGHGETPEAVRARLEPLAERGHLVSLRALRKELARDPAGTSASAITTIAIPSRDRAPLLERALRSHLHHLDRHGRRARLMVVDDSDGAGTRANAEVIAGLAGEGRVIRHITRGVRERLVQRVARAAGLPSALVAFALLGEGEGVRTGSARNVILLLTGGELVLQCDDDVVATLGTFPGRREHLALVAGRDPTEAHFPDFGPLEVPVSASGPLDAHERLLGRCVGDLVDVFPEVDAEALTPELFLRLQARPCRVVASSIGPAGDLGLRSAASLLLMCTGPTRARLVASEATYRAALSSRQIVWAAPAATISDTGPCMGICLGLDNRGLLPPFLPVLRNQDGIFGALLRRCAGDGLFGYLPEVVAHRPAASRGEDPEQMWRAMTPRLTDLVLLSIGASPVPPPWYGRETALVTLGEHLEAIGRLDAASTAHFVRGLLLADAAVQIRRLTGELERSGGAPAHWARDVETLLARIRARVLDHDPPLVDFGPGVGWEEGLERFRRLAARYGELVRRWPAIMGAAEAARQMDGDERDGTT